MPRRPSDSAFILALALRQTWRNVQTYNQNVREYNEKLRKFIAANKFEHVTPPAFSQEIENVFWRSVTEKLEGISKLQEALSGVPDADYRAVLIDAIKQPYNKVRGSKGFNRLVPELQTIRRYGPIDEHAPMAITEEEARDLADLIWQQEMEPFIEAGKGVDPINKQIIAKKVAAELRLVNVKYIGEEILHVVFDDVELDLYEENHAAAVKLLQDGINAAEDIFSFDPNTNDKRNFIFVRQTITMYNGMFKKEMDDEELDTLAQGIINFFRFAEQLIE